MNCKNDVCPLLGISLIPLTRGEFAIVDTDDYDWLMQYKWCTRRDTNTFYAQRHARRFEKVEYKKLWMHREIMQTPQGKQTDHRNHNGLDNRRANLRECSRAENAYNQMPRKAGASEYKGVYWHQKKWRADICCNGKRIHIGSYTSEENAAAAYDKKAIELFGEFACLNLF